MQQIEPLIMSAPWALDGGEHVPGPRALWVLRAEPTSLGMCKRSSLDWSVYTRTICFSPTLALPSRSTMQVPQWPCNDLII